MLGRSSAVGAHVRCPRCGTGFELPGDAARGATASCPACRAVVPAANGSAVPGAADVDEGRTRFARPVGRAAPGASGSGSVLPRDAPFAGRYLILRELGHGAMGRVYKALDTRTEVELALKVLEPAAARDPAYVEALKREVRTSHLLSHPNLVKVNGYEVAPDGRHYVLMEFVDGSNLEHLRRREGGRLPAERVVAIALDVCAGLQALHATGIVHRDVKPSNVMVDRAGVVRLLDYGIAQSVQSESSGTRSGTPAFMSPEQLRGEACGPQSDVYAMGILTFLLLEGRFPFEDDPASAEAWHLGDEVPIAGSASPRLNGILAACLQRRPEDRFPTAGALREALASPSVPLPARPVSAEETPPRRPAPRASSRTRRPGPAVVLLSLLLLAGVIGVVLRLSKAGPSPDPARHVVAASSRTEPAPPTQGPPLAPAPEAERLRIEAERAERRLREVQSAEGLLDRGDPQAARVAFQRILADGPDARAQRGLEEADRRIEEARKAAEAAEESRRRERKAEEERLAREAEEELRRRREEEARAAEAARKNVADAVESLRAAVSARDPAARDLWRALQRLAPGDAALEETRSGLAKIPFPAGTVVPLDGNWTAAIAGEASLPEPRGLVVLPGGLPLRVDPSGLSATAVVSGGRFADLVGLRWSAEKPQPVLLRDVLEDLGLSSRPPGGRVRWLPGGHVAFGDDLWNAGNRKHLGAYRAGSAVWGDAFFGAPSPEKPGDARTRIAPGYDNHDAVAWRTGSSGTDPEIALAWLDRRDLDGKLVGRVAALEGLGGVPFDFVPWGKGKKPVLLYVSPERVPVLLSIRSAEAKEVARGGPLPEGWIGSPTWTDLDGDGLREYVAPISRPQGLGILVLLAESP